MLSVFQPRVSSPTSSQQGVTLPQAQAAMDSTAGQLAYAFRSNTDRELKLVALHEGAGGDSRSALVLLFGVVEFVWLISCANVANLLLARG